MVGRFCQKSMKCDLLIIFCLLVPVLADYPTDGVEQDYCRTNDNCAGDRFCAIIAPDGSFLNCSSPTHKCRCHSSELTSCTSSQDCPSGERCFGLNVTSPTIVGEYCLTCRLASFNNVFPIDEDPSSCEDTWLGGYTGDICSLNYPFCAQGRECSEILKNGSIGPCGFSTEPCFCRPSDLQNCSASNECVDKERCAKSSEGDQACFSCGRVAADDSMIAVDSSSVCTTPAPLSDSGEYNSTSAKPPVYPANGLSLDYCRVDENCADSYNCVTVIDSKTVPCNETSSSCFCSFPVRNVCSSSSECRQGERCYGYTNENLNIDNQVCWSCRVQLEETDSYIDADPATCDGVWLGGYTGDICSSIYKECSSGRTCTEFQENGTVGFCSFGTDPCFCWPTDLTPCTTSRDCDPGERCAINEKNQTACFSCDRVENDRNFASIDAVATCATPDPKISPSISPTASPTSSTSSTPAPSPSPSPFELPSAPTLPPLRSACISMIHLVDIAQDDLVYKDSVRASVLCDRRNSCATPGHMVTYRRQPMMMATYCSKYAKCSTRTAIVNSPRMRQALRISSHTEDLYFTALSARYETLFEEFLIQALIFVGI